jgi:hypothetical protein
MLMLLLVRGRLGAMRVSAAAWVLQAAHAGYPLLAGWVGVLGDPQLTWLRGTCVGCTHSHHSYEHSASIYMLLCAGVVCCS